jgi:hypothetical protein
MVYKLRDLSFLRTLLAFRKTLQPMFSKKKPMFQNANLLLACIVMKYDYGSNYVEEIMSNFLLLFPFSEHWWWSCEKL